MSMLLTLARVDATVVGAIRADPGLLDRIFAGDGRPLRDGLAVDSDDVFSADYRTLDAIAGAMDARVWFDRATGGTDTVEYDLNYGSVFVLGPAQVSEIAVGLATEGWGWSPRSTAPSGETESDVDHSARTLGEAAEWDPDEIAEYGPMMAATGSADFNVRVVRAIGATASWDADTIERVAAAVATAEPEELEFDDEYDLGGFFAAAAQAGNSIIGGID